MLPVKCLAEKGKWQLLKYFWPLIDKIAKLILYINIEPAPFPLKIFSVKMAI